MTGSGPRPARVSGGQQRPQPVIRPRRETREGARTRRGQEEGGEPTHRLTRAEKGEARETGRAEAADRAEERDREERAHAALPRERVDRREGEDGEVGKVLARVESAGSPRGCQFASEYDSRDGALGFAGIKAFGTLRDRTRRHSWRSNGTGRRGPRLRRGCGPSAQYAPTRLAESRHRSQDPSGRGLRGGRDEEKWGRGAHGRRRRSG